MNYNDYELVLLAQEGNEDAVNILHDKYKPLIVSKASDMYKKLYNRGVELSDIIQEAMIGFEEAINDYNQDDNAIFYTFFCMCVDRQLKSVYLKYNRDKYKILNEAISLDDDVNDNGISLINVISNESDNPLYEVIREEDHNELWEYLKSSLTSFEFDVLKLRLDGFSYEDIAFYLERDVKSIDNCVQRIRIKIKNWK